MKPGIPWSVKGIEAETREAAKEAARRAGMTLGEWLNAVILDQSEDDDPPQPQPVSRRRLPAPAASPRQRSRANPANASDIESRLESLADKLNALTEAEQDTAVDRFMPTPRKPARNADQTVRTILDRLERHEQRTSDTIEEILERIELLGRELTELTEEGAAAAVAQPDHGALELALRNIVDHLEVSERRTREALRNIQLRLAELGQRAAADEPNVAPALVALEARLSDLATRLGDVERDNLAGRHEQIAVTVAQREVRALERKLEAIGRQAEAAERAAAAPPALQSLAAEVESLNQRFDDIKAETASDRDLRLLAQTVDQLVGELGRPKSLGQPAELTPELAELERRIDSLDLGLRQALEQQHLLQDAIHGLGSGETPQGQMLDALHRQIIQFTERVGALEGRVGHLSALENAMGQLYRALEDGRAEMSAVAEKVAARVAHGVFAQYGGSAAAAPSPELQALHEGLEAVRATSAQADQRSQETLAAVHETLEQIIVKLAELEARGPMSEPPPPPGAMPEAAVMEAPAGPSFIQPEPMSAHSMTWQQAVRAHLAAQGQPQPAAPLADFRLPPLDSLPEPLPRAHGEARDERAEPEAAPVQADEAHAAAMRHDFIAAARRAAMATQPPVGARRSRPEGSAGLLSRLGIRRGRVAADTAQEAAAPVSSMRRRLLIAGLVLLAVVSAYAVGTRDLPLDKLAPPAAAPAAGAASPGPTAAPAPAPAAPSVAPKLPEPQHPPERAAKTTAIEMLDAIATASLSDSARSSQPAAVDKAPTGIAEALWQAARSGDRVAAFVVASKFLDGREVGRNEAEAARWFERAAARGLAPAQYRLATLYERGSGVARDAAKAGRLYEQAAVQGNIRAMHNLAVLMTGSSGHAVDMAGAARWFREAALQGLKDSQFNMAILYERGLGVARSAVEAAYWYAVAAAHGDADAKTRVELLRATLSRRDGEAAVRRAAAFHPKEQRRDANVVSVSDPDWGAGPKTPTVQAPLGPLSQSEIIRRTKTILSRLGFNIGDADDTMDSRTANAIRLFQLRQGLPVNGMVSRDLLGQLQAKAG